MRVEKLRAATSWPGQSAGPPVVLAGAMGGLSALADKRFFDMPLPTANQ
jgi:hypothetical protein